LLKLASWGTEIEVRSDQNVLRALDDCHGDPIGNVVVSKNLFPVGKMNTMHRWATWDEGTRDPDEMVVEIGEPFSVGEQLRILNLEQLAFRDQLQMVANPQSETKISILVRVAVPQIRERGAAKGGVHSWG
jgi:hypothetical protein